MEAAARSILEAAWRPDGPHGFCVPNPTTYPWQWLWDSCFHAVVWAHLGDPRGSLEVAAALHDQDADGFVPHLRYVGHDGGPHQELWGRPGTSSITQPPMYGHALAELARLGQPVEPSLLEQAEAGLRFLLQRRRRSPAGLVELCHPWESGCDDSPRWDSTVAPGWTPERWYEAKGALVGAIERTAGGAPVHNPAFAVGSAGFSALVAWNARELATVTGRDALLADAEELVAAIDARWDPLLRTWVDDGPTAAGSGRVRTLDALLPLLVAPRPEAFAELVDPGAFGAPFGPTGVHRAEPSFAPGSYWRGSSWPQLTYLLWLAATSSPPAAGGGSVAASLAGSLARGAVASGWAEHWDPDRGTGLGARPQSWTTLGWIVRAR
jgi:hypothetical protein